MQIRWWQRSEFQVNYSERLIQLVREARTCFCTFSEVVGYITKSFNYEVLASVLQLNRLSKLSMILDMVTKVYHAIVVVCSCVGIESL